MKSSPPIAELLEGLVTKLSGSNPSERGSLARSLKNSHKLLADFQGEVAKNINEMGELGGKVAMNQFSFASQRWDTILHITRLACLRINPLLNFLCRTVACGDQVNSRWAQDMLKLFHVDSLLLLALVTELVQAVERFVHSYDNKGTGEKPSSAVVRLSHHGRVAGELRDKLKRLFHYGDGGAVPYVMHPGYEQGYVQLMVKALNLGSSTA